MQIDKTQTIEGVTLKRVRDLLRRIGPLQVGAERFAQLSPALAPALEREGLIERSEFLGDVYYGLTNLGRRLASARFGPRLRRAKAKALVADLLGRVDRINADDDLLYRVAQINVFGSYLTASADLGDIDLAMRLEPRIADQEALINANLARARANGHGQRSYFHRLCYGEHEVERLVKNGSAYLSLHPFEDLARIGCAHHQQIYPRRMRAVVRERDRNKVKHGRLAANLPTTANLCDMERRK